MTSHDIKSLLSSSEIYIGKSFSVEGWVRTVRSSGNLAFMEVHDGSGFKGLQAVLGGSLKGFDELVKTPIGSAVRVTGELVKSEGQGQAVELKAASVEVLAKADPEYPLQKKRHSFEFLRTIAHVRPRANTFLAVFRVRSVLALAIHEFFQKEKGFVYVHTPIITTSDCEGAGEMFTVTGFDLEKETPRLGGKIDWGADFFGKKAGLTVSGQLNAEAMCHAFKGVYTFGPTFRAENSNTSRHAAEFWMMEPEAAFAELKDNMDLAEAMVKYLIDYVRGDCPEEMEFFNKFIDQNLSARLDNVLGSDFGRLTYTEAIAILEKADKKFIYPVKWGIDLQSEHERYLCEEVYKKPVFVTDYPKGIKAFYMRLNDDGKTVAAMDLLAPGVGEIIGGSQREERLDILEARMREAGLKLEDYQWYREIRKYGGTKHAGYGMGFDRFLMYLTGMENIRDVIPFPRVPKNADF